ncbi:MAG TPA: transcriptional regulator NrdR [Gemmataceae bacterium]|jgi:transcriptional repressor NrdR|nr:transcriptional regulator NrdR [Gemmataceae bacterium]
MKCPFCREGDFAVVDSRSHQGGFPIRRRRSCDRCKRRVWTVEHVEEVPLKVVKKDDSRELFDPEKIRHGLEKACYKRPVSTDQIETIVRHIENEMYARYFGEVPTSVLGDMVMDQLKTLDQVAYVRFASVYREFKDISAFVQEVQPMLEQDQNGVARPDAPAELAPPPGSPGGMKE